MKLDVTENGFIWKSATANETFAIIKKAIEANDVDTMLKCPFRQVVGFRRLV